MARRFGRNQKRKMSTMYKRQLSFMQDRLRDRDVETARLRARLSRSVEVDVDLILDHAKLRAFIRTEMHAARREAIYNQTPIDEHMFRMERSNEERIKLARYIAEQVAHQILTFAIEKGWVRR